MALNPGASPFQPRASAGQTAPVPSKRLNPKASTFVPGGAINNSLANGALASTVMTSAAAIHPPTKLVLPSSSVTAAAVAAAVAATHQTTSCGNDAIHDGDNNVGDTLPSFQTQETIIDHAKLDDGIAGDVLHSAQTRTLSEESQAHTMEEVHVSDFENKRSVPFTDIPAQQIDTALSPPVSTFDLPPNDASNETTNDPISNELSSMPASSTAEINVSAVEKPKDEARAVRKLNALSSLGLSDTLSTATTRRVRVPASERVRAAKVEETPVFTSTTGVASALSAADITASQAPQVHDICSSTNTEEHAVDDVGSAPFLDLPIPDRADDGRLFYEKAYLLKFQSIFTFIHSWNVQIPNAIRVDNHAAKRRAVADDFGENRSMSAAMLLGKSLTLGPQRQMVAERTLDRSMMGVINAIEKPKSDIGIRRHDKPRGNPQDDLPLDIEIKPLEMSENGYRVMKDLPEDQKLMRSVTSILNKLTPEKFDILVGRVLELEISSASMLRDVVSAVFEKAAIEPNFSPTYAEFSVKLNERLPQFVEDNNSIDFRRLILNRCQIEFETDNQLDPLELDKLSEDDRLAKVMKHKRRELGIIRFIGELFSRKVLASNIMKSCITRLLGDVSSPVEENIEALCNLLKTVGNILDIEQRSFVNDLFNQMQPLVKNPKLGSRFRFMVQDMMELRARNWVARIKVDEAKKLSDLHAEEAGPSAVFGNIKRDSAPSFPPLRMQSTRPLARLDRYSLSQKTASGSSSGPSTAASSLSDGWQSQSKGAKPVSRLPISGSGSHTKDEESFVAVKSNTFSALDERLIDLDVDD